LPEKQAMCSFHKETNTNASQYFLLAVTKKRLQAPPRTGGGA
jgi:hypothetical protein